MSVPDLYPIVANVTSADWWDFKVLFGLVSGIAVTFVGFFLNQRHLSEKEAIQELREYVVALQSAANELEFYGAKLDQLSAELGALETKLEKWQIDWIIPTYSIYPDFLEQCKTSISRFFRNPDLVKEVGHCHFELCHILERLDLLKSDLRAPLKEDKTALTRQLAWHYSCVRGFKGLVDSNIPVFRTTRDALLAERSRMNRELETRKERSLLSTEG